MAFADGEAVMQNVESMIQSLWAEKLGVETGAFPRMTYYEAMARYGSDKPDTRLGSKVGEIVQYHRLN